MIIDFHTHIFPDRIAAGALAALAKDSGGYRPRTDGTLNGLLASMDRAGVALSVVAGIATKPSQMEAIFKFSLEVLGPRIYPLVSFHPDNPLEQVENLLGRASAAGLRGLKLHPMYQDFALDDRRMMPYYELAAKRGFFIVFHTGFDIAFPGNTNADIERVRRLAVALPELRIVATHTGGWRQWERVGLLADCPNVFTDISMTQTEMTDESFMRLLPAFGEDRIFFGSDSPWTDQLEMVERVRGLPLPDPFRDKILRKNAEGFLRLAGVGLNFLNRTLEG